MHGVIVVVHQQMQYSLRDLAMEEVLIVVLAVVVLMETGQLDHMVLVVLDLLIMV